MLTHIRRRITHRSCVCEFLVSCRPLDIPRVSGKRGLVLTVGGEASSSITSSVISQMKEQEDRTRRWGRGRHKGVEPKAINNRFGNVAPVWFYSLIGNFMDRKDDAALWGGEIGATLLSSMFLTLSRVVGCTGPNTPGVDVLAKDLFELVWSFRSAEVPEVRASVLYAVGTAIGFLREESVMTLLFDSSADNLATHLRLTSENDPDGDCRKLARALTYTVTSTLKVIDQFPLLS